MAQNTGGGYSVSVLPQVGQIDPRLFNTGGQLLGGLNQGLGAYQSLQNITDQSAERPIRRQLQQINLDEARARLNLAPLDQQLRLAQIAEAQQNAAVPRIVNGDMSIEEVVRPEDVPATDENGNPTGPAPLGDIVQVENQQLVGPGGVITPRVVRKTIKTAAERAADATKAEALNDYKRAQAEAARVRANALANNPDFKVAGKGTDADGNLVSIYVNGKTGEQVIIPTGLQPIQHESEAAQIIQALTGTGGAPKSTKPAAMFSVPSAAVVPAGDEVTRIINQATLTPQGVQDTTIDITKPLTPEQAATLPTGTSFIGLDGVRRTRK